MTRGGRSGFEEMEALIYRLFAEKQFALALLALVMVAQLLSAQFLLLRLKAPAAQASAAPASKQRLDVRCAEDGARTLAGEPVARDGARGKVVVVHLAASQEACLADVTAAGAAELVVGMSADARLPAH
jgi:biopolymer transport protein ExbD